MTAFDIFKKISRGNSGQEDDNKKDAVKKTDKDTSSTKKTASVVGRTESASGETKSAESSSKSKEGKKSEKKAKKASQVNSKPAEMNAKLADVLSKPRITEKAAVLTEVHAYTFDVAPDANKTEIKKAFEAVYKKKPIKVAIVVNKPKAVMRRGQKGFRKGFKKAIIYLEKGEKIELM